MGFRIPQIRELDPQLQIQQQQTMINPYFNSMMSRDENSHNRQLQLIQQKNEAEARRAAADIERSGAWTKGLDALTRSALPAAQSVHGMRIASRAQAEAEKTAEVSRTNMMENALATRQQRELDAQFAPRERKGGIGQTLANTRMIGTQTKGMETTNESAKIKLQQEQAQAAFEQADAMAYGFENARPGENIAQYTMRMNAEGKIADVERVKAESAKMKMDMQYMPERLRLEKLQTLANIESSRASAANARTMASVAVAGSNREQQAHELAMNQQKVAIAEKETDEVMKGISTGALGQLKPEEAAQVLNKKINDIYGRLGATADVDAAISRALSKNSADQKAAAAADIATANLDPARRMVIEKNMQQTKLAMTGTELLANLNSKLQQYESAGRFFNPEQSKLAASEMQATLDSAAMQEPRFKPYADKFREINEGVWAGGIAGIQNLFGDSPKEQAKALIKSISNTLVTELGANPTADPLTARALQISQQNLQKSTNIFHQMQFMQQQQQPAMPIPLQPLPQQQAAPIQRTNVQSNRQRTMRELDENSPRVRR